VLAHRLLWDGRRATGVELSRGRLLERVRARREVLVAAGAFGSPAVLLRSGVGPADQLSALGIPVISDLPVGDNLQDHLLVMLNYLTAEASLRPIRSPENLRLLREGRGPLTSNLGEAGGFLATRPELTVPDVQFQCAPALFFAEGLGMPPADGLSFGPNLLKPTSRGSVRLRSADADVAPRILHNHLQTEEDRSTIVDGVRVALEMSRQPALKRLITESFSTPETDSDADVLAFVTANAHTLFHPTSTCAIGSVVAPDLRVYGVDGLRVVDASVMPWVVRGNTNAPVIMIAERAVDLLRSDPG
jgi:choline dehydrogenase-like flavoprotein